MGSNHIRPLTSWSLARVCLGVLAAVTLLAAPFFVAQAWADGCAAMSMTMSHSDDASRHEAQPASKADCPIGCRLAPQPAPVLEAPLRVTYEIRFETDLPGSEGIVVDPPVPPPRRANA